MSMQIVENKLVAKVIDKANNSREIEAAYALRYKVFVEKLQWLAPEDYPDLKEVDEYDEHCIDFGVFTWEHELVGYARLILEDGKFMLEKEFSELIAGEQIHKEPGVAEISRLTILPGYRLNGRIRTSLLLYKLLYQWALKHHFHFFYLVIDDKFYYNLQKQHLVCGRLKPMFQYQKGVTALVAYVDLHERARRMQQTNPTLFEYLANTSSLIKPGYTGNQMLSCKSVLAK